MEMEMVIGILENPYLFGWSLVCLLVLCFLSNGTLVPPPVRFKRRKLSKWTKWV